MIVSTLIAATAAAVQPQATEPAKPHANHSTMEHGEKKMACCDKMAKGEGCDCCKGRDGEASSSPAAEKGHTHDH